jgi:hypothetical protein
MKSFLQYIKENYGVPLFGQEVAEEPPMLLLEGNDRKYVIRPLYNMPWEGPYAAEKLMDMLKHGQISVEWTVKKDGQSDMEAKKISLDRDLIGEFSKIKDRRNFHLSQMA